MGNYLVTGASGYIGKLLIDELSKTDKVYATVRDKAKITSEKNAVYYVCDMKNIESLPSIVKDVPIDTCIHLAWDGNSGPKRADYSLQMENVNYTLKLLDSLKSMGVKTFVGIGTGAEMDVLAYHLNDLSRPNNTSAYAVAKLSARLMTKIKCNEMGIEHVWCILGNTFGEDNTTMNFVNATIKKLKENEHIDFSEANQIYDFVYQKDVVSGIITCAKNGKTNCSYYIGSGEPRPLKEYIKTMGSLINPECKLNFGALPFNGTSLSYDDYSIDDLKKIGYVPKHPFEESLMRIIHSKGWKVATRE